MYITSQENEQAKTRFVHDLRRLLKDIPDFSPGNESDEELVKSMKSLQENLLSYCSVHDITTPSTNSEKHHLRAAKNSTEVDDIIDLPIVTNNSTVPTTVTKNSTVPTTVTKNSTVPTTVTNNSTVPTTVTKNSTVPTTVTKNSTVPTTVTNNSTVPTTVTNNSTVPTTVTKNSTVPTTVTKNSTVPTTVTKNSTVPTTVTNNSTVPTTVTNNSTAPTTVTNLETVDSIKNYVTIDTSDKENASQNVIKPLPLIPPLAPPPPPIIVDENHVISHDLLINQDSDCSSSHSGKSLLQEITTHERDTLRHVPRTPGGTPVRWKTWGIRPNNHAEILQKALINKFRTMHVHSTPKHNLGDHSVSMEISSTWSECDGNSDNHQYASDPDLTRTSDTDFYDCPPQISVCSAADFGSSFSSPRLQDNS